MIRQWQQKIFFGTAFTHRVRANGFTLAELLVSTAILGIVIAGILVSYIRCMELNEVSQNKSIATKAARTQMEVIKMTPFDNLVGTYDNVSFNVAGLNGKGISYVTVVDPKNTRVNVAVSWTQKNGRDYGEDKNLNGVVNAGEDANGNGQLNSPVDVSEIIFKRN